MEIEEPGRTHRNYTHPIKSGKVTIPFHQGKELNKKTCIFLRSEIVYKDMKN